MSAERLKEQIKVALIRKHLTQGECSERLGRSEGWLSGRLRNVQGMTVKDLQELGAVLGADFFGGA